MGQAFSYSSYLILTKACGVGFIKRLVLLRINKGLEATELEKPISPKMHIYVRYREEEMERKTGRKSGSVAG